MADDDWGLSCLLGQGSQSFGEGANISGKSLLHNIHSHSPPILAVAESFLKISILNILLQHETPQMVST